MSATAEHPADGQGIALLALDEDALPEVYGYRSPTGRAHHRRAR